MKTGISLQPHELADAPALLDAYPFINHIQLKLPPNGRAELKELKRRYPRLSFSIHADGHINAAERIKPVRDAWLELAASAIRQCAGIADFCVLHGGSLQGKHPVALRAAGLSQLAASAEQLLDICDDNGVELHLENIYPAPFRSELVRLLDRKEDFIFLSDAMDGRLRFCYDYGHGMIDGRGTDIPAVCGSRLGSVHLHENDCQNDLHMPISSLYDWHTKLTELRDTGFDGVLILENPVSALPQAAEYYLQVTEGIFK